MAKPDTDDGWFKIAIELHAALAFADFSKLAQVLISYALRQVYGRGGRPRLAYLNQRDIGMRIGQKRQNVQRAIRELVESRVLSEVRDDQYRFEKDYEKWVSWSRDPEACGKPRLTAQEAADCRDAPAYALAFQVPKPLDPTDPAASNGITKCIQRDDKLSSNGMTTCHPTGLHPSSNGMTSEVSAIEDHPRGIEFKREREKREERIPSLDFSLPLQKEETQYHPDPRIAARQRDHDELVRTLERRGQ